MLVAFLVYGPNEAIALVQSWCFSGTVLQFAEFVLRSNLTLVISFVRAFLFCVLTEVILIIKASV